MGRIGKVAKLESSIPVQSRVSFMSLAKLHRYWVEEGHSIRTMSQLVSWSVDLLCEVLEANEKMPDQIESLAEAHRYLQCHELYQKSTHERALKKIGTALKFETMRSQGQDPKSVIPTQHSMMHGRTTIVPDNIVSAGGMSDGEWEEIQRKIREENEKDRVAQVKAAVEIAKASGLVVSESEPEEPVMHSQEEVRAEFFKMAAEVRKEHPELSEGEVKVKVQAEMKGEVFVPEPGPVVKEGMNDEEYEVMMKDRKERDLGRIKLENAPFEASDLPVVEDE